MGLVTRDQLPFNPLDRTQKKWHLKKANDNLISIWTNTMVEIRDHASVSRQKCPRGSKLFRPRRFECCLGPRLKGLKSKVIFWVERAGLFVPLKIYAFHSRGPIVAAAGAFCFCKGWYKTQFLVGWTDLAKQTWAGNNCFMLSSTLNEFVT